MSYEQVLNYLMNQLPMFQRIGAPAYKADLNNIIRLCNIIGNPQQHLKCIHIAGTNGKGSVTHIIASVLQAQGYCTGVFSSPHYKDYRERIKINGKLIDKAFITDFVNRHYEAFAKVDASFFEITTAMMFTFFHEMKTDVCVIETGMGGRLDSTNVITPLLSVITNISFDHQQFLGNTLPKIAAEKAGIIKKETPVVIGETQPEVKHVFLQKADEMQAPLTFADKVIQLKNYTDGINGSSFNVVENGREIFSNLSCCLSGSYQQKNITTSIAALRQLQGSGWEISDDSFKKGLENVITSTGFIGRWMVKGENPLVIFDSAHNEGGLRELFGRLPAHHQLHVVFGTVADKDLAPVLKALPRAARYYFCKAGIPRAKDAKALQTEAHTLGLSGECFADVQSALEAAKSNASKNDLVLLTGSVFVVADAL